MQLDNIFTTSESGEVRVPLKTICEVVGIDWGNQRKKINEHFFLGQLRMISSSVALDESTRDQLTMTVPDAYLWLGGIGVRNREEDSIEKQKAVLEKLRAALFETIERAQKYTPQHELNDAETAERIRLDAEIEKAEAIVKERLGTQEAELRKELGIDDLKARRKVAKSRETKLRNEIGATLNFDVDVNQIEENE